MLANVLLKTENAGLKLTATNLEIGINCWVPGKVTDEGEITVPAKLLTELVSSLPEPAHRPPLISAKDRTLKVTCGGSRSSIKGIEADEFPVVGSDRRYAGHQRRVPGAPRGAGRGGLRCRQ